MLESFVGLEPFQRVENESNLHHGAQAASSASSTGAVSRSRPTPPAAPVGPPRHRRRSGWRRVGALCRVGQRTAGLEGQRLEVHARRVEVLVAAALGMDAVETAHHVVIHHVYHRLGNRAIHGLEVCTPSWMITCTSRPSLMTLILLRCLRLSPVTSAASLTIMMPMP